MAEKSGDKQDSMRKNALGLIGILIIQYLLGMFANLFVKFPDSGSEAQYWEFARGQLPIVLHMVVGLALFIGAISLIARSFIYKDKSWKISSITGFAGILVAAFSGVRFIPTQIDGYSYAMSIGFIVALLAYVWGVYTSKTT